MISSVILFLVFGLVLRYWSKEEDGDGVKNSNDKENKVTSSVEKNRSLPGPFTFPIIGMV